MSNSFVENKDRWLQIANGDFDYSILFIKCYLPFNAWYCNSYPQHNYVDSKIIKSIKTEENIFKTKIISLIDNIDEESVIFRKNIEKLFEQLERSRVPSNSNKISFKEINFRENPQKTKIFEYNKYIYKVEILDTTNTQSDRVKITVLKTSTNQSVFFYKYGKYDLTHLQNDLDFGKLSNNVKKIIISIFKDVNPKKKESLILDKKKNSHLNFKIYFVNDSDLIAQALIEIIYKLRCILFHGEIIPTQENLIIYEYSYYILKTIIKTLR